MNKVYADDWNLNNIYQQYEKIQTEDYLIILFTLISNDHCNMFNFANNISFFYNISDMLLDNIV